MPYPFIYSNVGVPDFAIRASLDDFPGSKLLAIPRSENRICKCFFFYGRFRDNSADLDVTAFPANIRAEQSALPLAVKGHPTAQAGPRLAFESIAGALRAPCTGLTASSEADGAKNLSAFVADFSDVGSVLRQKLAAL